jgi:UDP-GlcNAc3NAcA epimerase
VKILTIVGARPQFIKASAIARALQAEGIAEVLVHTGQHFDDEMSAVFFEQLALEPPRYSLGVNGGSHGEMTGRMLQGLDPVLASEAPEAVLVYGDTNSTLAGALSAAKQNVPVVHVEAGLRSYRRTMPEEINRILTDRVSTVLCCPTRTAVENLQREGFTDLVNDGALVEAGHLVDRARSWVVNTGDVMLDVLLHYRAVAARSSGILERIGLRSGGYALLTLHRAENTSALPALEALLRRIAGIRSVPVVFAVHPRTEQMLATSVKRHVWSEQLRLIPPQPYLDFLQLQANAAAILTDSGGVQKEAYFLGVRCITLRDETEWPETTHGGWNTIAGSAPGDLDPIVTPGAPSGRRACEAFGNGDAAVRIARLISQSFA